MNNQFEEDMKNNEPLILRADPENPTIIDINKQLDKIQEHEIMRNPIILQAIANFVKKDDKQLNIINAWDSSNEFELKEINR